MSTFEHDGETLWYDDLGGDGPALLALHGGLGLDHTYLRAAFDPLAADFRVVYLDLRANGRSTGDGAGMTMAQLASDVEALLAHLGLGRVAVFGHSYGGFVALQHVLDHPVRVGHLVLCATDTRGPDEATITAGLQRLGLGEDVLAGFAMEVETQEDLLAASDVLEPAYFPHSPAGTARQGLADTVYRSGGSAGGDAALAGWDVAGRLDEVRCPTLVLAGADDFLFPPDRMRLLAEGIAGARFEVAERSGHLVMTEAPERFHQALRSFLLS